MSTPSIPVDSFLKINIPFLTPPGRVRRNKNIKNNKPRERRGARGAKHFTISGTLTRAGLCTMERNIAPVVRTGLLLHRRRGGSSKTKKKRRPADPSVNAWFHLTRPAGLSSGAMQGNHTGCKGRERFQSSSVTPGSDLYCAMSLHLKLLSGALKSSAVDAFLYGAYELLNLDSSRLFLCWCVTAAHRAQTRWWWTVCLAKLSLFR